MRLLLAPVLLLAACASSLAAEPSPFRAALAAAGGCGRHRALAEERLGRLGAAPTASVVQGESDLFGKPAGLWTEAEIRGALAAFAACEARLPAGGRERLARDLRSLEAALRRAIVVGHARPSAESGGERPPHGSGRAAAPASAGSGSLRQGPAFIPAARTGATAPEGLTVGGSFRDAPAALAIPAAALDPQEAAVPAGAPGAPVPVPASEPGVVPAAAHKPPADQTQCPVSRGTFDRLQADMQLVEVEVLIGCRGSIDGTATIPGLGTFETYHWSDRAGSFTVTLVFQDKRLRSKSQRGLGATTGRGS